MYIYMCVKLTRENRQSNKTQYGDFKSNWSEAPSPAVLQEEAKTKKPKIQQL